MAIVENIRDWRGKDVLDPEKDKIGRLEEVYFDAETDQAMFLVVRTGVVSHHHILIPAGGVITSPNDVTVGVSKDAVKSAPRVELGGEFSEEDEVQAFRYYGFDYAPAATPSGRRLVRR
ncbi:MAG: photosystem reaction center subunit H [Acidimicrobiales bacterium]|nr:MAG: photosystem reaction center subunit H [Acidimicrobiales bacterium]